MAATAKATAVPQLPRLSPCPLPLLRVNLFKIIGMHWIHLTEEEQIRQIITKSHSRPQLIFKHSSRCSISSVALSRMQREVQPADIDFYFLDLLAYRGLSNHISEIFQVHHESPQVLLIKDGACVYDESHLGINMHEIMDQATAA